MLTRPEPTEYAEFYRNYIARVPQGPLLEFLSTQPSYYRQLLAGMTDEAAGQAPAPGKWSAKQVLGHLCDTERIISYRAMRFARGDEKELQGFEQDDYVREAGSNERSLEDLIAELESVRESSVALFRSLPHGSETRRGVANGNPVTVRALAYIVAGHAQHHYELLKSQLETRAAHG
ncbi:MAG TPA: DinB family protein [Terriglobales bacterium]|nr:DinB family protein [Terriglobales bacterium]